MFHVRDARLIWHVRPTKMLTYQVRPRVFRHQSGEELRFPAQCRVCFHLLPAQPFGVSADGGRTAVRAVAASALFDANSGAHTIQSKEPLKPLDVTIEEPSRLVHLAGKELSISQHCDSLIDLEALVVSVFFGLPALLNVAFADPPFVERVDGTVGSSGFRWELANWRMEFRTTTQEHQEKGVAEAWDRMSLLATARRRRLFAGLHYFHLACRLARECRTAGEFVAEVILNLAKALETIFPPVGDGRTREAARAGLRSLGFSEDEIEGNFLPAMALRNEIDVGHVELGLFKMDQLKIIHAFTERAESAFREMFERLLASIKMGNADVPAYDTVSPRREALDLIERLRKYTPESAV